MGWGKMRVSPCNILLLLTLLGLPGSRTQNGEADCQNLMSFASALWDHCGIESAAVIVPWSDNDLDCAVAEVQRSALTIGLGLGTEAIGKN